MATSPGAAFLAGFQTMDSSNRDWERIALAQQQQARQFAQQAVENKKRAEAQDFNQMLAMLKREDDNSQFEQQNRRMWAGQNANDILGNYNAQTGRENAVTSRYNQQLDARRMLEQQRYNDNPFGLPELDNDQPAGAGGQPSLPAIPSIDGSQGGPLFNFGGKTYSHDWGPATATVFGGGDDPEDNGISAFGGATGPRGREGVAIPAKVLQQTIGGNKADWERAGAEVTLADGTKKVLPIADLGTAERIWERNQGPTLDLTPGAVSSLGGTVVRNRSGQQAGVRLPSEIANVRVVPDFQQAAAGPAAPSPPDLSSQDPAITFAPASAASVVPLSVPAPSEGWNLDAVGLNAQAPSPEQFSIGQPALPSETALPVAPASFSDTDLTGPVAKQMTQLRRTAEMLETQASQAARMANAYQSAVKTVRSPASKAVHQAYADQAKATALEASVAAAEAKAQEQQLAKGAEDVRKLQQDLGKIESLSQVLPDADVQIIKTDASNPIGRGITETRIKTLADYDAVRKEQGLTHLSNGYPTAERVAIAGKRLEKAQKYRDSYDKFTSLQASIGTAGDDPREQRKIQAKIQDAKPGAEHWQKLKTAFDQAVAADTRPDPNAPEEPVAATADAPAAAKDDIFASVATPAPSKDMTQADLQRWTEAKSEVRDQYLGGREGVKKLIATDGGGDMTLSRFKKLLRTQLKNLEPSDGEDFPSPGSGFQLPKNAGSLDDVVNALAEDMWLESGRALDAKVAIKPADVSATSRQSGGSILERFEKPATK